MAVTAPDWETRIAALAAEPGFAQLREAATPVILWSSAGKVRWSSAAGAALLAQERGGLPAETIARLRRLAGGLAPRSGFRLERLRVARLAPPAVVVCRLLPDGEDTVLLMAIPRSLAASRSASDAAAIAVPGPDPAAAAPQQAQCGELTPLPEAEPAARRGLRFTWLADRSGRFTHLSPELAEWAGAGARIALGRRWPDLVGRVVTDEGSRISGAFAAGGAWSRLPAGWRDPVTNRLVPVELSGAPLPGTGGWRGFGLAYPDEARDAAAASFEDLPPDLAPSPEQLARAPDAAAAAADAAGETVFGFLRSWFNAQLAHQQGASDASPVGAITEPASLPSQAGSGAAADAPLGPDALTVSERGALSEIARALHAGAAAEDAGAGEAVAADETTQTVHVPVEHAPWAEPTRLLDDMPVGVAVLRDRVPLFVNKLLLDSLSARDLPDLVATDGLRAILDLEPGEGRAVPVTLIGGGEERLFEARATEIVWGEFGAVLVVLTPASPSFSVSELDAMRLELARRGNEMDALSSALDLAADGVVALDAAARLLSLNGAAERLFGVKANEAVGDSITMLIDPRDHRTLLTGLDSLRKGPPGARVECELRCRSRHGNAIPLAARLGRNPDGEGTGFAIAFRDITRSKLLEEELREARETAERASANRADFLARISHEVRTPLTAITGFAELMLEERFGPLGNERYKEYLRDVRDSGVHVISLVNDLLDLAKATSGRSDLQPVAVDLNGLAQQCVGLSGPLAGRERTILRTSFLPGTLHVFADERSVRQIVINVLSNAIRFAGAGGQVIVSTAMGTHGEAVLSVRDTGPGMSEDEIAEALTPFRQVPSTRRADGTGLGLPLSKALAEANGGALMVTSARDHGTLVEVRLPLWQPAAEAVAAE